MGGSVSRRGRGLLLIGWIFGLGLLGLGIGQDYAPVDMASRLQGPSAAHWLGTDWLGRDLLRRILQGTAGFFMPGLWAAGIALVLGGSLGAMAGYDPPNHGLQPHPPLRRHLSGALRLSARLLLALPQALPQLVTILLVFAVFGFDATLLGVAAGVLYAGELGQALAARVQAESQTEYVEALRAEGLSGARVLGLHILWRGCRGLVLRQLLYAWAFVLLVETTLSFLPGEFGLQEPSPSWGNILQGSQDATLSGDYWAAGVITLCITAAVLLSALAGDAFGGEEP